MQTDHPSSAQWEQNGPTEQGLCLIEVGDRVAINLTGSLTNRVDDAEVQRIADLITAAPALVRLLARLEPHLDAIICYASTMDEHEPNAIAADVRGWLGHLRDAGVLSTPDAADIPDDQLEILSGPSVSMGRAIRNELGGA